MANFLDYFKACIESFFTSKKGWIGTQSYPSTSYTEETKQGIGDYQEHVSPIDGYVNVQSTVANSRLGVNVRAVFISCPEDSIGTSGVAFPVRKGESLSIWCTSGHSYYLRFFKNIASQ